MAFTAPADQVSMLDFMDAFGLSSPEQREASRELLISQCCAAIRSGDTYGWPPMLVAQCKAQFPDILGLEAKPIGDGRWQVAA